MKHRDRIPTLAIAFVCVLAAASGPTSTWAQPRSSTSQELLEGIVHDVVGRAIEAARKEVQRNTGIDPLKRGYDRKRRYDPLPGSASRETRRELRALNAEHDRKIYKLEEELHRKLDKARAEFERDAAKEDKPEKIAEKRDKLREKVDEAYGKFEEKIGEENTRYDEKRWAILGKARGR